MVVNGNLTNGLGWVRGDVFSIRRTVNKLPSGTTITAAWLTVKAAIADLDNAATFQKSITSTDSPGTGQIEDTGADGSGVIRFDISAANGTAMTAGTSYFYDIQIKLSNLDILTLESGMVSTMAQVTIS